MNAKNWDEMTMTERRKSLECEPCDIYGDNHGKDPKPEREKTVANFSTSDDTGFESAASTMVCLLAIVSVGLLLFAFL